MTCVLHACGTPRPQPRARFVGRGAARRVVSTANRKAAQWRKLVESSCRRWLRDGGQPFTGPVSMHIVFYFGTDKAERLGLPHTSKPDSDNLAKAIMDVCERAGVLKKGDAKVAQLNVFKIWASAPGAVITIDEFGTVKRAVLDSDEDLGAAAVDETADGE